MSICLQTAACLKGSEPACLFCLLYSTLLVSTELVYPVCCSLLVSTELVYPVCSTLLVSTELVYLVCSTLPVSTELVYPICMLYVHVNV